MLVIDTLTFISEISKAFAWPLVSVILALVFKKPICKLIGFITSVQKVQYDKILLEFGIKLNEAKSEAISISKDNKAEIDIPQIDEFESLPPKLIILELWQQIERKIFEIANLQGANGPLIKGYKGYNENVVIGYLIKQKIVPENLGGIIRNLRILRNQAVHVFGDDITEKQVKDYYWVFHEVYYVLDNAKKALENNEIK